MPETGPTDEVDALRRKLAFYEGFDAIIQDNVRRSAELLREAEERHAAAAGAARDASVRLQAERDLRRDELSEISAGLNALSSSVAALARRVAQALAEADGGDARRRLSLGPGPSTLVVQDLADVAEARSLRDAVAGLPGIRSAEPREFSAGLLRLDLEASRAIDASELVGPSTLPLAEVDGGGSVVVLRRIGRQT